MKIAFIIIIGFAIVLAITGGLVESLNFLIWAGVVLAVIAVIAWLLRSISANKSS